MSLNYKTDDIPLTKRTSTNKEDMEQTIINATSFGKILYN
jgi:hypothetical protein